MTPFGNFCRKLRFNHCVSLKSQATALSVSPSYLSSLEHGKKGIPSDNIIQKVSELFSLNPDEQCELKQSAFDSSTTIKIPQNSNTRIYRVFNRLLKHTASLSKMELDVFDAVLSNKELYKDKTMET